MLDHDTVVAALRAAGVVAAEEEANLLAAAATSDEELAGFVRRRLTGEPPAWILGRMTFAGIDIVMRPGVYVPRWKTEALARHALGHLGDDAVVVDLGTGSGAIAAFIAAHRPRATVLATELDPSSAACAAENGVTIHQGDLFDPLPPDLRHRVDLVVAVPPYVPSERMASLPDDIRRHEPPSALDGGPGGLVVFDRILSEAPEWLTSGGRLVIEVGMGEVPAALDRLADARFYDVEEVRDADGDRTGVSARILGE